MTSAGTVTVEVAGRDVNLVALLTRLEAQMKRTDQVGIQLSQTTGGTFTAAEQRAANAAITEAQAIARAAVAAGDDARAHNILVTALGQSAAASDRSVASLTTQITKLEQNASAAQTLGGALSAVGIGLGSAQLLRGAADLTLLGAQTEQTRTRFDQLATQARTTGDAMLVSLRQASAGTISDTNLQLAAMKANLLGVATTADQLGPLLAIARDRAQQMGISTAFAFDSLVTGLGRGSRLILDNIGIMVKEGEVNEAYAKSVNKSVSALTDFEKKQALINEVVRQGNETIAATGGAIDSTAAKIERMTASMENLKARLGVAFADVVGPAVEGGNRLLELGAKTQQVSGQIVAGATSYAAYRQQVQATNIELNRLSVLLGVLGPAGGAAAGTIRPLTAAQFAYAQSLIATGVAADVAAERARTMEADIVSSAVAVAVAQAQQVAATAQHTQSMEAERIATSQAGLAFQAHTQELRTSAEASIADTAAKQEQATVTALAAAQAQAAADAFIALNPNMSASAAASAAAASGLSPLIVRLIEATLRAREARSALAAFNALAGVQALRAPTAAQSREDVTAFKTSVLTGERAKGRAEALAAAEAERRYQQQLGNTAPALAHARTELAQLTKGSAAYFNKLSEIDRLQDAANKKARGAGGAARLSDQQKLNNTLLSDQERYQDQAENAERAHQQKLLDIDAEFNRKSLEQQRQNEVSKRQSRADFYDKLTTDTKDIGPQIAQGLSAAYEAAYAQAQAIAQAGNQKLADDYLKMKQRQISAEEDFQKRLADARKNKDRDEVARLEAIHKLQQDANAEEEKQLLAGGDANVKARDEALAAEQRSFEEQQGKIATSAEQAAQRKIDAAQRSGKAVTDENVQLLEQEKILNRIGRPAASGAPVAPGATGGAAGTAPTQATSTPTANLDTLAAALDSIVAAIADAKGAITAAQRDTTGAVKGLSGRVMG